MSALAALQHGHVREATMLSQKFLYDRSPRRTHVRSTYRLKRAILHRLALVAGICCAVQFLRLHVLARHSLEAKYTTTTFGENAGVLRQYHSLSDEGAAVNRSALIAAKPSWRPLGSGCEGSTFAWNRHVIKTFKPKHSPFRNCIPRELEGRSQSESQQCSSETRWPTDIPASLIAGTTQGFLPVSDVFFASSSPEQGPQWHLVTPLMEGGTLQTLAKAVSRGNSDLEPSLHALDVRFRPRLNELLIALQVLHSKGLCHDDLKPDNVFVAEPGTEQDGPWLIGNLGNVREISHPYHSSKVWTHSNQQLPDCRANDALRATKTYLMFLRHAFSSSSNSESEFDTALLEGREPWARLLRRAHSVGNALRVGSLLQWSAADEHPSSSPSTVSSLSSVTMTRWERWVLRPVLGWRVVYKRASMSAMKISASDGWARVLGLTWILGVPVGRC
jgi:hypothetical protein